MNNKTVVGIVCAYILGAFPDTKVNWLVAIVAVICSLLFVLFYTEDYREREVQ